MRCSPLYLASLVVVLSAHVMAAAADAPAASEPLKRRTIVLLSAGKQVADMMLPFDLPASVHWKAKKTDERPDGSVHASGSVQLSLTLNQLPALTLLGDDMLIRSEILDEKQALAIRDLLAMQASDQSLRGHPATLSPDEWARQTAIDTSNMQRLAAIIEDYGWPGNHFAGVPGADAAFLVLQHADSASQHRYLPLLRSAVANNEASGADLAMLEDRVLVHDGKPQLYGTQFKPGNSLELAPVQDAAHLDQRRSELGLPPMAEYLKMARQIYQPN